MKGKLEGKAKLVAANIRNIREYKNYTQEYLAAKLQISQNAYSRIELGYTRLTLERFFHIALILEVDEVELLNPENKSFIKSARTENLQSFRSSYS